MANLENGSEPFDIFEKPKNGSRQWVFTVFSPEMPRHLAGFMTYCVFQRERCPFTGRLHWQCYAQFSQNVKFTHIQKWVGVKCHCEPSIMSNARAARNYCMKLNTREEGTEPTEMGEFRGRGQEKANSEQVRTRTMQVLNHAEQIELNRANILPGEEYIWQLIETNVPWRGVFTEEHPKEEGPSDILLNGVRDDVTSQNYDKRMLNGDRINADDILEELRARIRDA